MLLPRKWTTGEREGSKSLEITVSRHSNPYDYTFLDSFLLTSVFLPAGGMGIGMTVSNTLSHHSFLTDPHQAAHEVWEKSGYV